MRRIALLTILSMISLSAHANAWFCVGEKFTYVLQTIEGEITESGARDPWDEHKWIVDEKGVRRFDDDLVVMDQCSTSEGGSVHCTSASVKGFHADQFMIMRKGVFRFSTMLINEDEESYMHVMVVGKCREIRD